VSRKPAASKKVKLGSRYWRNLCCDGCELHCKYVNFKVFGRDAYQEMYSMLWKDTDDSAEWVYKSRGVILGKLHEWKLDIWEQFICGCPSRKGMK